MKIFFSILALVAACCAFGAFSSEKWLAERDDDSEALRLRAAYADCVKQMKSPAENISLPIETFTNGTVKSRVTAARANIFTDSGFVWGEKIKVEQYKPDGSVCASLTADNCLFDRGTTNGWVEGTAVITYGKSSVRGRGIYFSLDREFFKIFSQSEIRIPQGGFDPRSMFK